MYLPHPNSALAIDDTNLPDRCFLPFRRLTAGGWRHHTPARPPFPPHLGRVGGAYLFARHFATPAAPPYCPLPALHLAYALPPFFSAHLVAPNWRLTSSSTTITTPSVAYWRHFVPFPHPHYPICPLRCVAPAHAAYRFPYTCRAHCPHHPSCCPPHYPWILLRHFIGLTGYSAFRSIRVPCAC